MIDLHPYICELCHVQLLTADESNKNKFPVIRAFENNNPNGKLLAVRCVECNEIPYWLKEGNPSRADLFNREDVTIIRDFNREYNYWSYGIGHLFEFNISRADEESLNYFRKTPFELGFLIDEEVNLLILTHKFTLGKWNVLPYQWHLYWNFARDYPPIKPVKESDRQFTIAFINGVGGKYLVIRNEVLPLAFAEVFHKAIHTQIEGGIPQNVDLYRKRVRNLYELLLDDELDSKIIAKTIIGLT